MSPKRTRSRPESAVGKRRDSKTLRACWPKIQAPRDPRNRRHPNIRPRSFKVASKLLPRAPRLGAGMISISHVASPRSLDRRNLALVVTSARLAQAHLNGVNRETKTLSCLVTTGNGSHCVPIRRSLVRRILRSPAVRNRRPATSLPD